MFNLQGSELVIILLLALVVLGPEKLPDAMRKAGQFVAEMRKMAGGFQQEFKAAVDEPMRELRDTANTLRDSADFTKLADGERTEKPKSAEMTDVAEQDGVDPASEPAVDVPTFETPSDVDGPAEANDSKPAPFTQQSSAAPKEKNLDTTSVPAPPAPFTSMSSAAPRAAAEESPEVETSPADTEAASDGAAPPDARDAGHDASSGADDATESTETTVSDDETSA